MLRRIKRKQKGFFFCFLFLNLLIFLLALWLAQQKRTRLDEKKSTSSLPAKKLLAHKAKPVNKRLSDEEFYQESNLLNILAETNKKLSEIDDFGEINRFINEKLGERKDLLKNINLSGVSRERLISLSSDKEVTKKLKENTFCQEVGFCFALSTSKNHNCFFNSFSLLLKGDESLASLLRLALVKEAIDSNFLPENN